MGLPATTTLDDLCRAALDGAARQLEPVLRDAALAVVDPDYWGPCDEVYRGNPLLARHVMVDCLGNVVHVLREGETFDDEQLTITYLPSWLYSVLKWRLPAAPAGTSAGSDDEVVALRVTDPDHAVPLRVTTRVVHAVRRSGAETGDPPRVARVVYDLEPGAPATVLGRPELQKGSFARVPTLGSDRVHWPAPALRLVAAPGVEVRTEPLIGKGLLWEGSPTLETLKQAASGELALYEARRLAEEAAGSAPAGLTSAQALRLEIERRQSLDLVPALGSPPRRSGCAEVDLLAAALAPAGAQFQEFTRPDGVDLVLLTPAASAAASSDPRFSTLVARTLKAGLTYAAGAVDPSEPVTVRIRVDLESPDDRFAYSILLPERPPELTDPTRPNLTPSLRPWFRLVVTRTSSVQVFVDQRYTAEGRATVGGIVEYLERIDPIDGVPTALDPALCASPKALAAAGFRSPRAGLPPRPWTAAEVLDLVLTGIGLIPHPAAQFAADLTDYATLVTYLTLGTDLLGRELSRTEFGVTLGGILAPHVVEKAIANAPALRRLLRPGGELGSRLERVLEDAGLEDLSTDLAAIGAPP